MSEPNYEEGNRLAMFPPVQPLKPRVLIVDDNVDAADSLYILLSFTGYEARVAHCGSEAVELCRGFHADVALINLGFPDTVDLQLAALLRRQLGQDALFVAVTGWADEASRNRARDAGFAHCLVKPLDFDSLETLLRVPGPLPFE
ncbi:MAG TPA: response regulator [Steroidobacteraceae bacterium]|nr:response regulator [Steroidobacteraceae bacterium]